MQQVHDAEDVGVLKAVENVNSIIGPALVKQGLNVCEQAGLDKWLIALDGTPNKSTKH